MPIYNFRFIPYLYDAFKPFLVSHMIIFDETPIYDGFDDDYFNQNYENYWLSVGRLSQALTFYVIFFIILISCHAALKVLHKIGFGTKSLKEQIKKYLVQFEWNAYIRLYLLVYFDTTFFAVLKIFEGNNSTTNRKIALLFSYIVFVVNIVTPVILITLIFRRFELLKQKTAKQSFNTLLLRIDKSSKVRVIVPAYFFLRRCLTACLLTLPINSTFIFLQYVFILMSSHAFVLYMVAIKPFQTQGINWYVLANETFYSTLIIAMFIFSDATPELQIKLGAAIALISSLVLIVVSNLLTNIVYILRGRDRLKSEIRKSKEKRAEAEALERAEEEARKMRKKQEEEEFMRLPDDTQNNMSQINNTTMHGHTTQELNSSSKKLVNKGRNKKTDDNVVDADGQPQKRSRSKKHVDDVNEGTLEKKKKKKRKHDKKQNEGDDGAVMQNRAADQKDYL